MYVNYSIGRKMGCSSISVADVHNLLPGLKNCAVHKIATTPIHYMKKGIIADSISVCFLFFLVEIQAFSQPQQQIQKYHLGYKFSWLEINAVGKLKQRMCWMMVSFLDD